MPSIVITKHKVAMLAVLNAAESSCSLLHKIIDQGRKGTNWV